MKKLSKVQLKQQALVMSVADQIETQALAEIPGMVQCRSTWNTTYFQALCYCVFSSKMTAPQCRPARVIKVAKKLSAALKRRDLKRYAQALNLHIAWA